MFCVNCFEPNTQVTNSRPSKKAPSIWRRRRCTKCGELFTTYEMPTIPDNRPVTLNDHTKDAFNLGRLIVSISAAFSHDTHKAQYESLALALTIEQKLILTREALTPKLITEVTYDTLKHFDELAAMQYAAKHHLIATVRRRGRPSIASLDPLKP